MEKTYILKVQVENEPNGTCTAMVPDLPGLDYTGNTRSEALEGLSRTAPSYLGSLAGDGRTLASFHGSRILEGSTFLAVTITA